MTAKPAPLRIPFFDYLRQYEELSLRLDSAIGRVLRSGRLILGGEVKAFEDGFSRYCGCGYGVGVNSGTDAIEVALRAAGIGAGDEVITVPNTAAGTVSAIRSAGAVPVFADVLDDTLLIDPLQVAARVTPRTKAVIPVHLFGQPADMDRIMETASARGLAVIEDCAQAQGAETKGRKAGSVGHAGCFSFYPTKNLGAFGDGGMVVTSDPALASRARAVRTYGWESRDMSVMDGVNSRLDEVQAAVLLEKLPFLDEWNQRRYELAMQYKQLLEGLPLRLPAITPGTLHVFHLFVVRTPERDALMTFLASKGIGTLVHYPVPLHLQPGYRGLGYREGSFPVAERAQKEVLSLPLYPELTRAELEEVCSAIRKFFGDAG